jgi:hypothetical protein
MMNYRESRTQRQDRQQRNKKDAPNVKLDAPSFRISLNQAGEPPCPKLKRA